MNTIIYGIKNCDTMKKACAWLDHHKIAYEFHDYKKSGPALPLLKRALAEQGWENVLNRKGTSWRALPEEQRAAMNETAALKAAQANPSLIRRPLLVHDGKIHLGFTADSYAALFAQR